MTGVQVYVKMAKKIAPLFTRSGEAGRVPAKQKTEAKHITIMLIVIPLHSGLS
jgi:hypothetical protein